MKRTNAAQRLYKILNDAKAQKPNGSSQQALAGIFKTHPDDLATLYSKFSQFLLLIEDVNIRIQALDSTDKEIILRCIPQLRKAFGSDFSMQGQWNQYINRIGDSDIGLVHFAAKALAGVSTEIELEESNLSEIFKETNDLFEVVKSSNLDPELRIVLLDLLEAIRRTIVDYQIRGAEGLKRVLSECLGRLALDKDIVIQNGQKDEMKSFWTLLSRLSTLFGLANQAPQIGERIGNLITMIKG